MSVTPKSLGLVTVTAAGTPQPLSVASVQTKDFTLTPIKAFPGTGNVGNVYLGTATMNKGTGAGVYRIIPTAGGAIHIERPRNSGEFFDLSQWYIDADNTADGVVVGYYGE